MSDSYKFIIRNTRTDLVLGKSTASENFTRWVHDRHEKVMSWDFPEDAEQALQSLGKQGFKDSSLLVIERHSVQSHEKQVDPQMKVVLQRLQHRNHRPVPGMVDTYTLTLKELTDFCRGFYLDFVQDG